MLPARRRSLLPLLALAGCRSANPNLYSLAVPPGPTLAGGPKLVALREVSLAGYLDRQQVVRSSEDYRLTVSESDWWGEPLSGMLTRVLAAALAQRLPRSSVVAAELGLPDRLVRTWLRWAEGRTAAGSSALAPPAKEPTAPARRVGPSPAD